MVSRAKCLSKRMMHGNCIAIYSLELSHKIGLMRWRGKLTFSNYDFSNSTFHCWVSKRAPQIIQGSTIKYRDQSFSDLIFSFKWMLIFLQWDFFHFKNIRPVSSLLLCSQNTGKKLFFKIWGHQRTSLNKWENHSLRAWRWDKKNWIWMSALPFLVMGY